MSEVKKQGRPVLAKLREDATELKEEINGEKWFRHNCNRCGKVWYNDIESPITCRNSECPSPKLWKFRLSCKYGQIVNIIHQKAKVCRYISKTYDLCYTL